MAELAEKQELLKIARAEHGYQSMGYRYGQS